MGIRVGVFKIVYSSTTMEAMDPQYLGITKDKIEEYLKKCEAAGRPMPEDPAYSREDMIGDITGSSGFYSLPDDIRDDTADFIATLIGDLI